MGRGCCCATMSAATAVRAGIDFVLDVQRPLDRLLAASSNQGDTKKTSVDLAGVATIQCAYRLYAAPQLGSASVIKASRSQPHAADD
ncbi:hypothetical protein P171DRAFT_276 [Karstenula rhodostoma CBS 690.94]|uniref:Uncharacterized protein n=1 Tax=Karstenula rhodostoma CBS 690.94 TaxID=1392251 RepID=A0A9P4PVF7_9PLEO|nr:hypothetical protein P171DRAFT_276 [Karstenula rhodostoma CBS 690.94]